MNEWFRKLVDQLKTLWGKWSTVQKIVLLAIVAVSVVAIVLLVSLSSRPSMVELIGVPVEDEERLRQIASRLDAEGIEYRMTADQKILVPDAEEARRARAILIREDLIPTTTDPWAVFDVERWTITEFERNVNLRRAITKNLEQHIEALDDVDSASVTITMPEDRLFVEEQNPVTASIILTPRPGSDIVENRNKIEGIVKLVQFAVEGLAEENITITDQRGIVLNDFAGMAEFDRLELARREIKTVREAETTLKARILRSLQAIFTEDRVQIVDLNITPDFDKQSTSTEEHFPITMKPDNPSTPWDDSEVLGNIAISKQTEEEHFEGTGFNPEGPPGQEGQMPPAYKDLDNLVGKYDRSKVTENQAVNKRNIEQEKSPWEIDRITVSVAIDGIWKNEYNERGEVVLNPDGSISRTYIPVSDEDLEKATALVRDAVGYSRNRGDSVTVEHLPFDRTQEHLQEDEQFRRRAALQRTILYALIGLGIVVVTFVVFRVISREVERKRRLREEELSRQHQAMREAALRSAEEEGVEVEMSVEERARMEMQENAVNMAREHPEDVAQLIRTWLMEE
jgi:flagellar M-ring protein FliF